MLNLKSHTKCFLFILGVLISYSCYTQSNLYVIEANSDNDAFAMSKNYDRYYSYGIGLNLSFTAKKLLGLEKLFENKEFYYFTAGFRIDGYTPTRLPYNSIPEEDLEFDRPFAGSLYATFDANYIFKRHFFKTQLYVGLIGPQAGSKNVQDWIHKNITGDELLEGWQYQMPNHFIMNINAFGAYDLTPNATLLDVFTQAQVRLGNMFIDASPGVGIRFGKFNPLSKSLTNSHFSNTKSKELYLQSVFSLNFVGFDGTAQGQLFNDDYEYSLESINHFYTNVTLGFYYSINKFTFGYHNNFTFGQVNKNFYHNYARIILQYKF